MKYVIDCSVGFKWFVVEPDRPKTLRLRDDFTSGLLAPDIFPTELGNALRLHMVSALADAGDGRNALVVDFRQIFSLPVPYLRKHAASLGSRWRLQSPYREHFSQAFARFFMRVGLPAAIPAFK